MKVLSVFEKMFLLLFALVSLLNCHSEVKEVPRDTGYKDTGIHSDLGYDSESFEDTKVEDMGGETFFDAEDTYDAEETEGGEIGEDVVGEIEVIEDVVSDTDICTIDIDKPSYLLLMPLNDGRLYIGWRLDKRYSGVEYDIYRKGSGEDYVKLNESPILNSTNYIDSNLEENREYFYKIKATYREGSCQVEVFSEERSIVYRPKGDNVFRDIRLKKTFYPGQNECVEQDLGFLKFGDVDGDGEFDFLISIDCLDKDGNIIVPATIQMHNSNGTLLWHFNSGIRSPNAAHYYQWTLWDLDGDGRAEVFGTEKRGDGYFLHLKDGLTGVTKRLVKVDYPVLEDYVRGPYHAIAYIDGKEPYIVVAWGTYYHEDGYVGVYDKDLNLIWKWSAPPYANYGGAHSIRVGDVDLDGKDEIIHGSTVFNEDGKILWREPWNHCDELEIGDILPERPGIELFYCFEQQPFGVRLVEGESGKVIWESHEYNHCHLGWTDDFKSEYPGMESYVWYQYDQGGWSEGFVYSAKGEIIERGNINYGTPIDWDGVPPKETLFTATYSVDLIGDYREEQVYVENTGGEDIILRIFTNTSLIDKRRASAWDSDPIYRLKKTWTGK